MTLVLTGLANGFRVEASNTVNSLGIDYFIFSGYPHLEESYRVAELLFPHLPLARPADGFAARLEGPVGEVIANDIVPSKPAVPV